ncbi:Multifunctional conjugation protein TraI [Stieleria neptunia]|uniref:Multifunctional conjugation protein TraI n=1 Tax=Stieleria neptunia TaxID=2527979 RepID=A0A518HSZ6_9BACT|nr:MobF family relaxase [Stieleria neptunia]QDV43948.1 Multifunctional conjugation protein TraI [Stieleria neptunia]
MLSATTIYNANYWLDLAKTQYYTQGGEPPGYYLGRGADALGYEGNVGKDELRNLMKGFGKNGEKLVQNAGKTRHQGYDFCFSAPKSVSVFYAASDRGIQNVIRDCQKEAVNAAIAYVEDAALFTRRGKGGQEIERATAIGAAFEHITSRAGDPQLHTHVLLANACVREDGTTGTFYGRVKKDQNGKVVLAENPLFDHIKAAGAIYRLELATKLQESLRVEVVRDRFSFELNAVPESVIETYSKRSQEIDDFMQEHKLAGSHSSQLANLQTRTKKQEVNRQELDSTWKQELNECGLNPLWAKLQTEQYLPFERTKPLHASEAIQEASTALTQEHGAFRESQLVERLANESIGTLRTYQELKSSVDTAILGTEIEGIDDPSELVSLGIEKFERLLTDKTHFELEHRMCGLLEEHAKDRSHKIGPDLREQAIRNTEDRTGVRYNRDYLSALLYLTIGNVPGRDVGATRVLIGDAGSGKTTLLATARDAFERAGYRVVGAAIAGKAADELTSKAGIQSTTVSKWFHELAKSDGKRALDAVQHLGRMAARTVNGKDWWHLDNPCFLDENTVLVIDEAGMTDTPQLSKLYEKAVEAGSLVIWSGDDKQCQAIGHGGFFSLAAQATDAARLTGNYRQVSEEDKELVKLAAAGDARGVIENLHERDRLRLSKEKEDSRTKLVEEWKMKGIRSPKEHQILVSTNEDRLAVNEACQKERQNIVKRKIGVGFRNHENQTIFRGDRVVIRENLILSGQFQSGFNYLFEKAKHFVTQEREAVQRVRNGQTGTVVAVNPFTKEYSLKMDDGRFITLPSEIRDQNRKNIFGAYHTDIFGRDRTRKVNVSLGYALTTHLSQGSEYKHSYVLTGGRMQDRELSYVQLSRGTHSTKVYATEREAGMEICLREKRKEAIRQHDTPKIEELEKLIEAASEHRETKVENSLLAKRLAASHKKEFASSKCPENQPPLDDKEELRIKEEQRSAVLREGLRI